MGHNKENRKSILKKLSERNLISKEAKESLSIHYSDILNSLVNDEIVILNEIVRIDDKRKNNEKMTEFEESLLNTFLKLYNS